MVSPVTKKSLPKDSIDPTEKTLIRVLHVDDEAGLLKVAKQILEMQGSFQVETALSVNEAMEKMKKKAFDVIVSDYVMPERNGLDFLRELREGGNDIPFILFTGKGREEVAIRALNLGADRYFNKIGHPEAVYGELAHGIRQAVDIKRAEETLKKSEEKYRSIVDLSPDGIATMNMKGTVTSVNKAFLDLTGFSKDEIVGKHFTKLGTIQAKNIPKYLKLMSSIFREKTLENFEFTYVRKDGTKRLGEARISLMKEKGKKVGLQAILRDITERKQMEENLRESEEKYRKQFEGALDAVFLADAKTGIILDCNRAATELVGREKSEIVGKHQSILHPPEEIRGKFSRTYKLHLKKKEGQVLEAQVITKTGEIKDVEIKANVFELGGRKVMHGTFRDATERKRIARTLQASEEKYRRVVEQAPDSIMTFDVNGVVTSRNKAAKAMAGTSNEDVIGKHFSELESLSKDDTQKFLKLQKSLLEGKVPEPFEIVYHRKDGASAFGEVHISLMKEGERITGFQAIMRDVTERKAAEDSLRKSEGKSRTLLENLPQKIFFKDKNSVYISCNENYARDLKIHSDEIAGKTDYDFYPKILAEKYRADDKRIIESGETEDIEEDYIQDGHRVFVHTVKTPVKDENDNVVGILGIFWDITEQKLAWKSLEETMNELATINEKLGVVGKLTRHDARNKLSVIANNVYLVKQKLADNPSGLEYLGDIESAIDQIEKLFDFATIYELLGMEELSYVNVEKSVKEAAMLFPDLAGAKLVNECHGLTVLADSMLRQLFYNLMDDTIKHGEKVSQIKVYYKEGKDHLKLVYEDDGVGIPKDEKELIFKEGYGKGTGYGLYLIKKMCETYGWTIQETGKPRKGAQFTMTIPKIGRSGKIGYTIN